MAPTPRKEVPWHEKAARGFGKITERTEVSTTAKNLAGVHVRFSNSSTSPYVQGEIFQSQPGIRGFGGISVDFNGGIMFIPHQIVGGHFVPNIGQLSRTLPVIRRVKALLDQHKPKQ